MYLGRWYEYVRSFTVPFESADCGTATYVKEPKNYIGVNNVSWSIEDQDWTGEGE